MHSHIRKSFYSLKKLNAALLNLINILFKIKKP